MRVNHLCPNPVLRNPAELKLQEMQHCRIRQVRRSSRLQNSLPQKAARPILSLPRAAVQKMEYRNSSPPYLAERMHLLPNDKQQKPTRELLNRPGTARRRRAPKLRMTRIGKRASANLVRMRILSPALRRMILQSLTRKDIYTEEGCGKTAGAP